MKILLFSHYYTPEGNAGATRASALAERWVKAGHDVTVITCPPNVPNGIVYDGYENVRTSEIINDVKVERVKIYIAPHKGAIKRMLSFLSYFIKALIVSFKLPKPDIAIATSPQFFCAYVGVWYKRLRRVPVIIEIRDIWPESIEAVGAKVPFIIYKVLEIIEKALYRVADRIVTVGEGYKEKLLEKGIKEDKISIIMNGTDLSVYKPKPKSKELLIKFNLDGKFIISYIGTVGMACGLEVVLEAAQIIKSNSHNQTKEMNNVIFLIVGDGAQRERLESEAKQQKLENVIFTGRQPKASIPDWISSSDASLVHLKASSLFTTVVPSKIFESAGCKKPIIMGVDGYAKKLVMDAKAGLDMAPESAESLVDCVKTLVNNRDLCELLGENAYKNIALVHNRDKQADDYLKIIEEIIK